MSCDAHSRYCDLLRIASLKHLDARAQSRLIGMLKSDPDTSIRQGALAVLGPLAETVSDVREAVETVLSAAREDFLRQVKEAGRGSVIRLRCRLAAGVVHKNIAEQLGVAHRPVSPSEIFALHFISQGKSPKNDWAARTLDSWAKSALAEMPS